MTRYVLVLLLFPISSLASASHLGSRPQTLECSEKNFYCGQTLGHTDFPWDQNHQIDKPQVTQESCEEKMEAAMRAMDEFVIEPSTRDPLYRTPAQGLREAADREDRRMAAINQWQQVKRECWRAP